MIDILKIRDEQEKMSYEEAYNTAIEKLAEGIIYVESFHVIYEPMRIVNEQKECMKAAVKKATELKSKVLKETMREEFFKLFDIDKTEEENCFPFITWESGKAWSIEELKELKVKE